MSQLYFVLTRRCNQYCVSCPRHQENRIPDEKYDNVKGRLFSTIRRFEVDRVTLSGGEPTLFPFFPDILRELDARSLPVLIQTNGQRFRDRTFAGECFGGVEKSRYHILTAIHSLDPEIHDRITGVKGSWRNVVEGIHVLRDQGVRVTVKHILSAMNYRQLPQFAEWVSREFDHSVGVCVSGMDYIGMSLEEKKDYVLDYREAVPYMKQMLDRIEDGSCSFPVFVIIELPLCMIESGYHHFFLNTRTTDQIYQDAYMSYPTRRIHDFTTDHPECMACAARENCPGIWEEHYKMYGDCIHPITALP